MASIRGERRPTCPAAPTSLECYRQLVAIHHPLAEAPRAERGLPQFAQLRLIKMIELEEHGLDELEAKARPHTA